MQLYIIRTLNSSLTTLKQSVVSLSFIHSGLDLKGMWLDAIHLSKREEKHSSSCEMTISLLRRLSMNFTIQHWPTPPHQFSFAFAKSCSSLCMSEPQSCVFFCLTLLFYLSDWSVLFLPACDDYEYWIDPNKATQCLYPVSTFYLLHYSWAHLWSPKHNI